MNSVQCNVICGVLVCGFHSFHHLPLVSAPCNCYTNVTLCYTAAYVILEPGRQGVVNAFAILPTTTTTTTTERLATDKQDHLAQMVKFLFYWELHNKMTKAISAKQQSDSIMKIKPHLTVFS